MKDEKSIESYEFSTIEDYFSKYIDIIMATRIPDENKLTIREKEFFVSCMVCEYKKISILSDRGEKFIEEHSRCKNKDYYGYKKKLISKQWLVKTKAGYILPSIFDCNLNKGLSKKIFFNFTLSYEQDKSGDQGEARS